MDHFKFWEKWNKGYKSLYLFLMSLFALSIAFYCFSWFMGMDAVINWIIVPELESIKTPVDSFIHNLIRYSVDVNSFLVKQMYAPTGILVNPESSYIYLIFVLISFCFFLALISYLDIFWYGLGMAFFLFFLASLKTELLRIYGMENRVFLISMISVFLVLTYYFHSLKKDASFLLRLGCIALMMIMFGIIIGLSSQVSMPFLFLANFSLPIPIILCAIFLCIIGYDLVYMFLYLSTAGKSANPKGRWINFLIITTLYLLNLILILLKKMMVIDWDLIFISPFIIYLLSAVIGIWAFYEKNKKGNYVIPFYPYGAFLYLTLAIISTASIALAFITGNDPLVESFEYFILYTHIAFGLIFMLYIFINFGDFFQKNVSIYKVAFIPTRVPYIIMIGVSFVLAMGIFFYSNKYAYYLSASGYYNLGGDAYYKTGNNLLAGQYYREGMSYAYRNHRSNYSLATIALKEAKNTQAQAYLNQAMIKDPSPYSFVQLSNLYQDANMIFPALFMLQDGNKQFETNTQINNNLGLLFEKTNSIDSAYIYLDKAYQNNEGEPVPATNLLAFLTQKGLVRDADSLSKILEFEKNPAFENNSIILKNLLNEPYETPFIESIVNDSILNGEEFSYLYNYGLKYTKSKSHEIFEIINPLSENPYNSNYSDHLKLLTALNEWYTGDKFKAVKAIDILRNSPATSPYFNKILGMLLFKQKAYENASFYLKDAHLGKDQESLLYLAIALTESGAKDSALQILNPLTKSEFEDIRLIANNISLILKTDNLTELKNWDDELTFQFMHFRKDILSEADLLEIHENITDKNIQAIATAELIEYYLKNSQTQKARTIYDQNPISDSDNYYIGELNLQYLNLLLAEENWVKTKEALTNIYLNDYARNDIPYFRARIADGSGQDKEAHELYTAALKANPFREDVYIYASDFLLKKNLKDDAYNVIVNGLELQPNSIALLKAYIKLAYNLNLDSFAVDAIEKLKGLVSQQEFVEFEKELDELENKRNENLY